MGTFEREVYLAASPERVFHFHDDERNLPLISPPELHVEVINVEGAPGVGHRVMVRMRQFMIPQTLQIEFVEYDPPHRLVDMQLTGPFRSWRQVRDFSAMAGGTCLRDSIEYELPLGPLGRIVDSLFVQRQIASMFAYRHQKLTEIFGSLASG